jgi:DNA modification methylase
MKNSLETKPRKSASGPIWQLGDHRLAQGDCRDGELLKTLLGDKRIKLICTDPPYGVAVVEAKRNFRALLKDKEIANDHLQSDAEYRQFSKDWLSAIVPYLAQKNSAYIFNADKMVWSLRDGMIDAGLKVAQILVWIKQQSVVGRLDYAPQHELIMYGWYGTHHFRRSKDKSVLFYPRPYKSKFHPTMKPEGLIRRLVLNSTNIGDVVFDGFLGSGTSLLACENTKRRCYGVELDPEYCKTIIKRWEKLTGLKAKRQC